MADFNLERIRFRWKNEWTASTAYIKDDMVYYKGKTYACLIGHTSNNANLTTDLLDASPKWELMLDGYAWKGNWANSTYYAVGEIVKFNGYLYKCISAHTSTNLTTLKLISDIARWTIVATTYNWLNTWTTGVYYNLGDVIRYNGITYICSTTHRSALTTAEGLEANQASWTVVTISDSWQVNWSTATRYKVRDIVKYGGIVYRCVTGHTSAATAADGLEVDQAKWEIFVRGIEYKGMWTAGARYKRNDLVKWNSSIWSCVTAHTAGSVSLTEDSNKWVLWVPGSGYEDIWNNVTEYKLGDIVLHGGYSYIALTNNTNSVPSLNGILQDTGDWELLTTGYRHRGDWSTDVDYKTGDVVRNSGYLYVAIDDSSAVFPDTETHWQVLVKAAEYRAEWEHPVIYYLEDVVVYEGTLYKCIQRHASTTGLDQPDTDVAGAGEYWTVLAQGTTTNVLRHFGDIRTHDGTETVRLAIGNQGSVLKSTGTNALWDPLDLVTKVYYVSTVNGDDIDSNGKTMNSPFKTIRYAMQYILADEAARAPATVFVKTGIYEEILPIVIPANVALVGDELRSTNVQPAAGYETSNMFLVRNGSGIRNMTLQGLSGTLSLATNQYGTRTPTAGAFVSLDPGTGPGDTSVHITTKSPYVQNVSTFGTGCIGMKIDGTLHNGGNKSIVANDFTQILSDGIGYWANDTGRSELVSVFTYYCYIGYYATDGGILRATNGNNSYGTYGSRAEGYSLAESPVTAKFDNRTKEAQVSIVHTNATNLVAFGYSNAGEHYTTATPTVLGAGLNANALYEEFRNSAIKELRVLAPDDSSASGGINYQYLLNSAQAGDSTSLTLAAADTTGTAAKYVGMRLFIDAGLGIGQYGEITSYDDVTKIATVSRESDGQAGWDHIYEGFPIEPVLDNTTRYKIEPRITIDDPQFTSTLLSSGRPGSTWEYIVSNNSTTLVVAPSSLSQAHAYSTNSGTTWTTHSSPLRVGEGCTGLAWTGRDFVIGGTTYFYVSQSGSPGAWTERSANGNLVSFATDNQGNIVFSLDNGNVRYSANHGDNDSLSGNIGISGLVGHGHGKFIILSDSGDVAYSLDNGVNWTTTSSALTADNWVSLVYGNGKFVALSNSSRVAYSFNGITWYEHVEPLLAGYTTLSYGQGVFLATRNGTTVRKSQDGKVWRAWGDDSTAFSTTASANWKKAAYVPNTNNFILVASGTGNWNRISTGARPIIRAVVESSRITSTIIYNPGSNYPSEPVVTVFDPENTIDVQLSARLGNGVLPQPTIANSGVGYLVATATVSGDGYADIYQTGKTVFLKQLTELPGPGDNLVIDGIDDVIYRVTAVDESTGEEGNYSATVRISPPLGAQESPEHETDVLIRKYYSQIRLTGHDFLDIGTGNFSTTQYPNLYVEGYVAETPPSPDFEVTELGGGRVFYTSTDQEGNFRVGELFTVEQSTGIVSINADFFDLNGLEEISLGGIQVGGTAVVIREFSKEPTFAANSNNIVPTQRAIARYLESRISSGGADAITNTLIASQVRISGTSITTTSGLELKILAPVNMTVGADADYLALQLFMSRNG